MNGKDLFEGLGSISQKYYDQAENGTITPVHKKIHRPFMIAALIAMMLLLTGCAVVYVLSMRNMKVAEREVTNPVFNEYMEFEGNETVTQQVLTLNGVKGTPSYQAAQEWFEFRNSYDPDGSIADSLRGNRPEYDHKYDAYGPYTQEMVDKLDEISEKYNLKLKGALVRSPEGLENIFLSDSGADAEIISSHGYENGSWAIDFFKMRMPEEEGQWPYPMANCLYYNKKDCFSKDLAILDDTGDWVEWNYTTVSGQTVLMLMSPTQPAGWIICDRADAMIAVQVEVRNDVGYNEEGKTWFDSTYMSNKQFEKVADAIDFGFEIEALNEPVRPVAIPDQTQTQNGCTMTVKSLVTDGYAAYITLGVTIPESEVMERDDFETSHFGIGNFGHGFLLPRSEGVDIGGMQCGARDDGDGLNNTFDLVIEMKAHWDDGGIFQLSPVWDLCIEDIEYSVWDREIMDWDKTTVVEGSWNFELNFEDGDFREIELISEPVTAKASTGWRADGSDVYENVEITSFKLRSLSCFIQHNARYADIDYDPDHRAVIVMKDGSQANLYERNHPYPVPVDVTQVDYVLLADGTKIPAPEFPAN